MQNKEFQKKLKKNYDIAPHTTYKIGGRAKYYIEASNTDEIITSLEYSEKNNIKRFILGGGSNLLFADKGFNGLVIKINNKDLKFIGNRVKVDAGVNLRDLVLKSAKQGLSGLEYLAGIPGSVGGAIRGNAGAYGHEMANVVESINVIIYRRGKFKLEKLNKREIKFSYRGSIIKDREYVIVDAIIKLQKSTPAAVKKIVRNIIKERNEKQPYEYPSAGCVFKNIEHNKNLRVKEFEVHNKVPAARIIQELGLKGKSIGGAKISEKHANFIINTNHAKASDVIKLIKMIKAKAKAKYGIELEEEIKLVE